MLNLFKKKPDERLIQLTEKCLSKISILDSHKTLSSFGRYEALICCSFIEMQTGSYPDSFKSKFLRHLVNIRTDFDITTPSGQMVDFLNSRMQFYFTEINNVFNSPSYINGKIYSAFYESPLSPNPKQSDNLPEVIAFSSYFAELLK